MKPLFLGLHLGRKRVPKLRRDEGTTKPLKIAVINVIREGASHLILSALTKERPRTPRAATAASLRPKSLPLLPLYPLRLMTLPSD